MKLLKITLTIVCLIIGIGFAMTHDAPVVINLYVAQYSLPLSLVLLLAMGIGLILGSFISLSYFVRIKRENSRLKRQHNAVEQEMNSLRAEP